MPLFIIKGDITVIKTDAIVNSTNSDYLPNGMISNAIHSAAGYELFEECKALPECREGCAQITKGYKLPCKYVIHTVSPFYAETGEDEEYLQSCYTESLYLAQENNCKSIAFPLIGIGGKGFPKSLAINLAVTTINDYLKIKDDINVFIVVYDETFYDFISEKYKPYCTSAKEFDLNYSDYDALESKLNNLSVGFYDLLMSYIKSRGMTASECYSKALVDKRLFSKIKNKGYMPSKLTVIQFAFALKLTLEDTQKLLRTCGYILSNSLAHDVIVMHLISQRQFDVNNLLMRLK